MSMNKLDQIYELFISSNGISTDTRTLKEGQIFFALKGSRFDGNQHAQEALKRGASHAIIDNDQYAIDSRTILVHDTLIFLQELALVHRKHYSKPVIGITGSNGKTTTKELLSEVLQTQYSVEFTKGNYNNHIGVPLTILDASLNSDIWIIEMGTNAPGEIADLCNIARPTLGLITNIGAAHLEKLLSLEGVYKEKTALFNSVADNNGVIFINQDDQYLKRYSTENIAHRVYKNDSFGEGAYLHPINDGNTFLKVRVTSDVESELLLTTSLIGDYNLINISAVLCVADFLDIKMENAIHALSRYLPNNMRSQLVSTKRNTIVLDSYNANPTSMRSSLESFVHMDHNNKVVVIGDMLELGDESILFHQRINSYLEDLGVNYYLIGQIFHSIYGDRLNCFKSADQMIQNGILDSIDQQMILIKGSRGIKLEKLVPFL